MATSQRQKVLLAALGLYWPLVFILTHIPIPEPVRQAHMSDKSLHVLTYMILTFLLWSVVRPSEKAHWRRPATWCVLLAVIVYALLDEYLQNFVAGRSPDVRDLVADTVGAFAGLVVAALASFWPGALIVIGATIYTLAVFTRANMTRVLPVTSTMLHLATYGLFTLLWIGWMDRTWAGRLRHGAWYVRALVGPLALLAATKISEIVSGKQFEGWEIVAGLSGILGAIAIATLARKLRPGCAGNDTVAAAES